MTNNEYFWPGLVAIALALVYPIYWVYELGFGDFAVFGEDTIRELSLTFADWLFLAIGAMMVYVIISLKRILIDQLNFHGIDLLLSFLAALTALYYIGSFVAEAILLLARDNIASSSDEGIIGILLVSFVGFIVIAGLLEVLIGIFMIREFDLLPLPLKIFSIVILIVGLLDITVILSFIGLFLFPVSMLVLAAYFLQKPRMLEVV